MAVQMLPTFWDQVGPQATDLVQGLHKALDPDAYARDRLQKMTQADPTLPAKIANMSKEEQNSLATSLGFKKSNPWTNLPMGLDRQEKVKTIARQDAAVALDPEGTTAGAMPGARTKAQQQVDALKPKGAELELEGQELSNKGRQQSLLTGQAQLELMGQTKIINGLKIDEAQKDAAEQSRLKLKFPELTGIDFGELADKVFTGKPVDPDLLSRIATSPSGKLFQEYIDARKQRFVSAVQKSLAQIRTPQDLSQAMGALKSVFDKSNGEYMLKLKELEKFDAENGLLINGKTALAEGLRAQRAEKQAALDAVKAVVDVDEQNLIDSYEKATGKKLVRNSVSGEKPPAAVGSPPPVVDNEAQLALDAIKAQPQNEARIRQAYKAKTGKDLP